MKYYIYLLIVLMACTDSKSQKKEPRLMSTPCEGCEAVFEFDDEQKLNPIDTLPEFDSNGQKLKLSGTIYMPDGKTPAEDVILYVYHTNKEGIYPTKGNEEGWGKRHGYLRGWIKTDNDGKYTFYTFKPGSYPSGNAAAHIHATVLEPDGKYYYLADFFFEDDPNLSPQHIMNKNGGLGVISPEKEDDILVATRDIVLGENVDGY